MTSLDKGWWYTDHLAMFPGLPTVQATDYQVRCQNKTECMCSLIDLVYLTWTRFLYHTRFRKEGFGIVASMQVLNAGIKYVHAVNCAYQVSFWQMTWKIYNEVTAQNVIRHTLLKGHKNMDTLLIRTCFSLANHTQEKGLVTLQLIKIADIHLTCCDTVVVPWEQRLSPRHLPSYKTRQWTQATKSVDLIGHSNILP